MNMTQEGSSSFASSVRETPAVKATGTNGASGVEATSDTNVAVQATSTSGHGVVGITESHNTGGFGVQGISPNGHGVHGYSRNFIGVSGESETSIGVAGKGGSIGVEGVTSSGIGIFGTSKSGLAGQFEGNVQVKGNLSVTGAKAFVQVHPSDPSREIVYVALEGGEAGTYVRGSGQLQSGKAVLALPEHFGLVTENAGLTVQLTPRGQWLQLYVVELDTAQLVVREAQGKSGVFDYLIQGVRKGSEPHEVIRTKR